MNFYKDEQTPLRILITRAGYQIEDLADDDYLKIIRALRQTLQRRGIFECEFYTQFKAWAKPVDDATTSLDDIFNKLGMPSLMQMLMDLPEQPLQRGLINIAGDLNGIKPSEWRSMRSEMEVVVIAVLPPAARGACVQAGMITKLSQWEHFGAPLKAYCPIP